MSARNMAKRTAAGTLALAVCLSGGAIALAGAAQADANFKFERFAAGDTRFQTAVDASKKVFDKSDDVVLVNGWSTVDGLTASYLAGVKNAPILYTEADGAPQVTLDELKRLGAKNVWVIGGTKVVSEAQVTALKADHTVERINGEDRYETAANIAEAGAKVAGKPSKVIIASGDSWADALSVSPISYGKKYPIILTGKDSTPKASTDELGDLGASTKIVVGGEAVVSKAVYDKLTATNRVHGADRAETANRVADWAKADEGFKKDHVILVGGDRGADSMVASALGGKNGWNLHYAGWAATQTYLTEHSAELTGKGFVFGGTSAVSDADVTKAQTAAQSVVSNESIKVGPADDVSLAFEKVRQYSITGLDKNTKYRVTLVDADNISKKDGYVVFAQDGTSGLALAGDIDSQLTVVNGVSVSSPAQTIGDISPADGSLSFTVTTDDETVENLVPVVYVDGGANTRLELDSAGRPTEKFGLGGAIQVLPPEAAKGDDDSIGELIVVVNKSGGYFATDDFAYKLSDKDTYFLGENAGSENRVSKEVFLKALSESDTLVSVKYNPDFGSTFVVENTSPVAPDSVTAVAGSNASAEVKLSWAASTTESVVGYNVYANKETASATTKSELVKVGSTTGRTGESSTSLTVKGLTASSAYTFVVTSIDKSGEESELVVGSGNTAEATTTSVSETVAPTITNVEVVEGSGVAGILDEGDTVVLDFSENMAATLGASGSTYLRIGDSDAVVQLATDGTRNQAVLNGGASSTVSTGSDGTRDRLYISIGNGGLTTISGGATASIDLTDGAKITLVSPAFKDTAGNALDLAKSSDVRVDDENRAIVTNAFATFGTGSNAFRVAANAKYENGNGVEIKFINNPDVGSTSDSTTVSVSGKIITVTLSDGATEAIDATGAEVVDAINGDAAAAALVTASGGSTTVLAAKPADVVLSNGGLR